MKTKIIYRKYKDGGEVIAVFPELKYPGFVSRKGLVLSYEHIGQHGEADYDHIMKITTIAFPKEYEVLKIELERVGYDLEVTTHKEYQKLLTV